MGQTCYKSYLAGKHFSAWKVYCVLTHAVKATEVSVSQGSSSSFTSGLCRGWLLLTQPISSGSSSEATHRKVPRPLKSPMNNPQLEMVVNQQTVRRPNRTRTHQSPISCSYGRPSDCHKRVDFICDLHWKLLIDRLVQARGSLL